MFSLASQLAGLFLFIHELWLIVLHWSDGISSSVSEELLDVDESSGFSLHMQVEDGYQKGKEDFTWHFWTPFKGKVILIFILLFRYLSKNKSKI